MSFFRSPRDRKGPAPSARRRAALRRRPALEAMEGRQLLSTLAYNVTTNEDSGSNAAPLAGSLRWAIIQADKVGAGNAAEIDFKLPANVLPTFAPDGAPLPSVTAPTFFNGSVSNGAPAYQLDGSEAGAGAVGLQFLGAGASGSKVVGLQVINFNGGGIQASGASNLQLDQDWVGIATSATFEGTRVVTRGNGTFGVEFIHGSNQNSVTNSVISSNQYNGLVISDHSNSTLVRNTRLGTDPTGSLGTTASGASFGNGVVGGGGSGVVINGGSSYNVLDHDVISDNHDYGVFITDYATSGNQVTNSQIGTDVSGNMPLGNHFGITVANQATSNFIGFNGSGDVISGNAWDGVQLLGVGTSSNLVQGDKIGTNSVGGSQVPNGGSGVAIAQGASSNTVDGDLISGNNGDGVYLSDAGTAFNSVTRSKIGTDVNGTYSVPNNWGVLVQNGAHGNTIGGSGAGDLISGNRWTGVEFAGGGTSGNTVANSLIGLNASGTAALANPGAGVAISGGASGNTVSGDTLSGNGLAGAWVSAASGNVLVSDLIGTNAAGTAAVPNGIGVEFVSGSSGNTLRDSTVSGNGWDGVQLLSGASGNHVQSSKIGTDPTGTVAVPNRGSGVAIAGGANGNTVGGPDASYRNVISGNGGDGLYVSDSGTSGNIIQYNFIGTDATGEAPVSNAMNGVILQNGASWTYVYNDLISANLGFGVVVTGGNTNNNTLTGDWIGLDASGTRAVKALGRNFSNATGVEINAGAYNTSVGSNVISGNGTGLAIEGGATSNWVVYDKIGTDVAGTGNVGNLQDGVILDAVAGNLIGYDTIAYSGDVGILGEVGANADNNSLVSDNLFGNRLGSTDFD